MKFVQISRVGTGSTVLVNVLHGLVAPHDPVRYVEQPVALGPGQVCKTHCQDYSGWCQRNPTDVAFVTSERPGFARNVAAFRRDPRTCVVLYADLLETPTHRCVDIVRAVAARLTCAYGLPFGPEAIERAVARLRAMNRVQAQLAAQPFTCVDAFYAVHGSHRGRSRPRARARRHRSASRRRRFIGRKP